MSTTVIDDLDLSVRAYNVLRREGILTLASLCSHSYDDLRAIRGMTNKAMSEILTKVAERKVTLAPMNSEALVSAVEEWFAQRPKMAGFTARQLASDLGMPIERISAHLQTLKNQSKVRCGGGSTWWVIPKRKVPRDFIYVSADGARWDSMKDQVTGEVVFTRVDADGEFRPSRLWEVIKYHGALSIYDSVKALYETFVEVMEDVPNLPDDANQVIEALAVRLDASGYKLVKDAEN